MSTPPRASVRDPLHEEKQITEKYGHLITPREVHYLLMTVNGLRSQEGVSVRGEGPIVRKHRINGHNHMRARAINILLDNLLRPGQPFEDLLQRYSRVAAADRALSNLRYLGSAHEAGIWDVPMSPREA